MKTYTFFCSLLFAASTLVGCGGGSSDSADSAMKAASAVKPAENAALNTMSKVSKDMLQGQWASSCVVDDDGMGQRTKMSYSEDKFEGRVSLYQDASCSYSIFELNISGKFALGGTDYATNGTVVTEFDRLIDSIVLRPTDFDYIAPLILNGFCGYTDWRQGESKDVTDCVDFEKYKVSFDIIQFNEDIHSFGESTDSLDGSLAAKRPKNIKYQVEYRKVFDDENTPVELTFPGVSRGVDQSSLDAYFEKLKSYAKNFKNH